MPNRKRYDVIRKPGMPDEVHMGEYHADLTGKTVLVMPAFGDYLAGLGYVKDSPQAEPKKKVVKSEFTVREQPKAKTKEVQIVEKVPAVPTEELVIEGDKK